MRNYLFIILGVKIDVRLVLIKNGNRHLSSNRLGVTHEAADTHKGLVLWINSENPTCASP